MPRYAANDRRVSYDLIAFDSSGDERNDDPEVAHAVWQAAIAAG